jgi:hypothetical protein
MEPPAFKKALMEATFDTIRNTDPSVGNLDAFAGLSPAGRVCPGSLLGRSSSVITWRNTRSSGSTCSTCPEKRLA